MSIEAHIQSIAKKRDQIKALISAEMAHPSPDFLVIKDLKKQNLLLKEEMKRSFLQLKAAASA